MRRTHTRTAAALAAVAAGGIAVYAMQPADKTAATLADRTPVVQYRTQVIRRTVHVVRHARLGQIPKPRTAIAAAGRGGRGRGSLTTGASGSRGHSGSDGSGSGSGTGGVVTRSSGNSSPVGSSGASRQPVATRASGGGHSGNGGDHADGGDHGD